MASASQSAVNAELGTRMGSAPVGAIINNIVGSSMIALGLAPAGQLAVSGPRVAGAVLGVVAVAVAQLGRPVGQLAVGLVAVAVVAGLAVAVQSALNGRVAAASSTTAATVVNFAVATPFVLGRRRCSARSAPRRAAAGRGSGSSTWAACSGCW
ncbi:DMT family transporter [Micromonospora sp. LOL_014]|uniref:DMT family transporter n=1 Tax=Micromonospora sp. LOL_014 TaxID=3345415 RepID=UPI003A84F5A2